jgi:hypothetical protein
MKKMVRVRKVRRIRLYGFDGSYVNMEIDSNYSLKRWNEHRCWSAMCGNPFYLVHLNRNGKATHAYCHHGTHYLEKLYSTSPPGKWGHVEKGRFIVDKPDKPEGGKE